MRASTEGYRTPARLLHWVTAVLVLGLIPAGFVMIQKGIPRPLQDTLFVFHKNAGVLVLLLVLVRLVYRRMNPPPPLPDSVTGIQRLAAEATHVLLYGLLFLMPVAGYVRVRAGGFPIESLDALGIPALVPRSDALADFAKGVHFFGGWTIALLVAMHVGAALMHGIVKKDGVFSRMWPPIGPR